MADVSSRWTPILGGSLAEPARLALEDSARDLDRISRAFLPADPVWAPIARRRLSLSGGSAGLALFFANLDKLLPGWGFSETAAKLLELTIDGFGEATTSAGLFLGFPGAAWLLEHLREDFVDSGEDPGEEIGGFLREHLSQVPWQRHFDLVEGLTGLGVYALERIPQPYGQECLELVIEQLSSLAERQPQGITWWTPPHHLSSDLRALHPNGVYDLGLAHGVPGVVALLGRVWTSGIRRETAGELLEGAVRWILAQELEPGSVSSFPFRVAGGVESEATHLAWCYGDLGIAAALLLAARSLDESAWEREALRVARRAASRPLIPSKINHPGLCHGAAGIAHLFNRFFQATGEEIFEKAAISWFEHLLAYRRPGEGIGGYIAYIMHDRGEMDWHSDPGFLTGAAGIGLSLLSGLTSIEPTWDRLLLISGPQIP
jgi:lantibiotic modifying enzyme